MKTVFLGEKAEHIRNVFKTEEKTYCKKDVLDNPEIFKDTEYIFSSWGMSIFTEEEIKKFLPKLKAVFYGAGTVQYFARPFLSCGVKVFSAWSANAVPVAEYTVAQIILANKGFYQGTMIGSKEDYYKAKKISWSHIGNYGAKIGIIGAGMIGKLVIKMLKPYKLEIMVFDPFLPDDKALELGVEKCSLERIFSECNVISNHLADNEQTKGMLNGSLFNKMLINATFLNTGRGHQVVEEELSEVLKNRPDIVAVLDITVTDPEPPENTHPFYEIPNCILTPHIAGSLGNEVQRMGEYMREEYKNFTQNKPCKYEVTLEMLKTMA